MRTRREVWARVGAAGTWQRAAVRHDRHGTWTRIRPISARGPRGRVQDACTPAALPGARGAALHREAPRAARPPPGGRARRLPAGVRLPRRPGLPLAGRRRLPLALPGRRKDRDDRLRRRLRAARRRRVPIRGARVRTTFFTVVAGTAARTGAPASYLEVRAAHPRRSGKCGSTSTASSLRGTPGFGVVIGVTVTVHYQPGAHPQWRTAVRFGARVRSRVRWQRQRPAVAAA